MNAGALLAALHCVSRVATERADPLQALQEALEILCGAAGFAAGNALRASSLRLLGTGVFQGADAALRDACARVDLPAAALVRGPLEQRAASWGTDFDCDPRAAALAAARIGSRVACPILLGDELVFALELFSSSPERPDPLVLAAVEQAAALLAMVAQRARTRQLLQREEELARKAAEEALWQSESRFRAIFEGAGVGLALGNAEGTLVRVNRAYGDFLGCAPYELAGRNVSEFLASDDIAPAMAGLRDLQARRTDRVELERRYLRRGGTHAWGRITLTRLPDTDLIIGVLEDVDARRRAEDAVRQLSGRILLLQDEERRRIARSLHESAAQSVAALSMNLQRMERMALPPHARETLADTLQLASQTSREIRTLSHLLHPPLLDEAGLPSSLRWYVQGFAQRSNVEVALEVGDDVGRLSRELELTLFRVVQESLTNVHLHSGSRSAAVRLRRDGPDLVLEVEDHGVGIPAEVLERLTRRAPDTVGVGIVGMSERLAQLGGTLEISALSPGTLVHVSVAERAK